MIAQLRRHIIPNLFPEVEAVPLRFLMSNLYGIDMMVSSLGDAVQLFTYANSSASKLDVSAGVEVREQRRMLRNWAIIGAKAGAMYVFGFDKALSEISKNLSQCHSIKDMVDGAVIRSGRKSFREHFPNFEDLRNAAAHPAEFYGTPAKVAKHSSSKEFNSPGFTATNRASYIIDGSIIDGRFSCTVEGQLISYAPNSESVAKLKNSADLIWSAFEPVFDHCENLMLQKRS